MNETLGHSGPTAVPRDISKGKHCRDEAGVQPASLALRAAILIYESQIRGRGDRDESGPVRHWNGPAAEPLPLP